MKQVLVKPILTEKTYKLAQEENKYTFEIMKGANKKNVALAVAAKFKVKVEKVGIMNKIGKAVFFGKTRTSGRRKAQKKAVVTLKKGDKIDLFEMK